jgi:hypothetical protein
MNNYRKAIRARVVELLVAATGEHGVDPANIFSNRAQEVVMDDKFPCLVVNTRREEVKRITRDTPIREYEMGLPVKIDCLVEKNGPIGDTIDDLVDSVLTVLLRNDRDLANDTDPAWGDLVYVGSDIDIREDGKKTMAVGYVEVEVIYQASVATIAPDDFEDAHVDYQLTASVVADAEEGSPGTAIAADDIELPQ